jgi:AcrR family transcriptional regulator
VFATKGFHGASVGDVAADAGYTTGAVYSNFGGKEDLFLAAFEHEVARHAREVTEAVAAAGDDPAARTRAAAGQWTAFLDRAPERFLLFVEYWAWSVRDPERRERFGERFAAFRATTERMIAEAAPGLPVDRLAVIANALTYGIAFQRLAEPDAVREDAFAEGLALVFAGAVARGEGAAGGAAAGMGGAAAGGAAAGSGGAAAGSGGAAAGSGGAAARGEGAEARDEGAAAARGEGAVR